MSYSDKQITCVDCGVTFTFTAAEQERYEQLGFSNEPKRCASCRAAKKAARPGRGDRESRPQRPSGVHASRESFAAVCAQCGKETTVPFKPRGDRPVYCSDCFKVQKR